MRDNKLPQSPVLRPGPKSESMASGRQRGDGYVPASAATCANLTSSAAEKKEVWGFLDIIIWLCVRRLIFGYTNQMLIV